MKYKNDIPFIQKGLEVSQISFSGGRVAASVAAHGGLTQLDYYGAQRFCDTKFFKGDPISAWGELFRLCAVIDRDVYYLEFNDTLIHPYGYSSSCVLADVTLAHSMTLLNDALVHTLTVVDNPKRRKVSACVIHGNFMRVDKPSRNWGSPELDERLNAVLYSVRDSYSAEQIEAAWKESHSNIYKSFPHREPASSETFVGLVANGEMKLTTSPSHLISKMRIDLEPVEDLVCFSVVLGHQGQERFKARLGEMRGGAAAEAHVRKESYCVRLKSQPRIRIPNKSAQSLLMNVPSILDSMKVADLPGGMRAADSGYWIWGWDSMVFSDALCMAGDLDFVRETLEYYKRTADHTLGIFHAATLEGKPYLTMAFPAQCLYAIMLYHAYVFTGDAKLLAAYLPFAHWILARAADDEVPESGLIKGPSLYPDNPRELGQDGENDLSVFNNGIYYQALRAMAGLAKEVGETEAAANYTSKADRLLASWGRFYDSDAGFFYDSISTSFEPRRHHTSYAVLWVTEFAADLVRPWADRIARFMKENFTVRHGVRVLPQSDPLFMSYAHHEFDMYMPVVESFHREMMKLAKDAEGVGQLFENIEWFWNQLCIPESLTCGYANHGITVDNPGRKQGFCARAWLSMFHHVVCGLNFDLEGVSLAPSDAGDIMVENLLVRGKALSLSITGEGWGIESLNVNGKEIAAPYKIPYSALGKTNDIVLRRRNG